ncbi:MAG: bifunctional nuclease family protein [Microbacterium sp.]
MVQVRVAGVALDASGQHVILLKPLDDELGAGRILPIWVGQLEATSILIATEGASVPRPIAHDLMRSLLEASGASVAGVEVSRLEEGTFYAEITLTTTQGDRIVDARPSDAIALAARVGSPIAVADSVMAEAGMPDILTDVDAADRLEEFRRFIDDVEPEDFGDPDA